jgi:hypothetical protein
LVAEQVGDGQVPWEVLAWERAVGRELKWDHEVFQVLPEEGPGAVVVELAMVLKFASISQVDMKV